MDNSTIYLQNGVSVTLASRLLWEGCVFGALTQVSNLPSMRRANCDSFCCTLFQVSLKMRNACSHTSSFDLHDGFYLCSPVYLGQIPHVGRLMSQKPHHSSRKLFITQYVCSGLSNMPPKFTAFYNKDERLHCLEESPGEGSGTSTLLYQTDFAALQILCRFWSSQMFHVQSGVDNNIYRIF